ncbi:MAG: hypothetical protein RLY57_9 [Candidatus Parcubacteria bacterium]|jgi:UDP-N-acetylmuramate dehydrogenase
MKLSTLSSFKLGGDATRNVTITTERALRSAVLESKHLNLPFHVVGKGTNTIFHHEKVDRYIIINALPWFDIVAHTDDHEILRVGAGEHWDDVVKYAVEHHLSGIEAMSAIPGSTGAAPVQNIGAYGQEIKDTLEQVRVYDTEKDEFITLSNSDCKFGYRESVFKHEPNRYIITYVYLRLSKAAPQLPQYPGVKEYFEKHQLNQTHPSLIDIRNAITEIRKSKLPDPSIVPNCGSFFKNAIVSKEHFETIQKQYPTVPHFPSGNEIKISTGWLLEQAGFKDKDFGNFKTHDKNALVMTHIGDGTLDELKAVVQEIQHKVKEMFGVEIEMEVNVVE